MPPTTKGTPKHPHAFDPGHSRTIVRNFRVSPKDNERINRKQKRSRARTFSEWVRFKLLTGDDDRVPDYETQRELINALMECTAAIQHAAPGKAQDRALDRALAAVDRIIP